MNFKTFSNGNLQRWVNETGDDDAYNELRTRRSVEQLQDEAHNDALASIPGGKWEDGKE